MRALIAVLAGDGIGAEVTAEAVRALERVAERFGHSFRIRTGAARRRRHRRDRRGAARRRRWRCASAPTRCCWAPSAARSGPIRTPQVRPEQGLLQLRKALGLFANLRPVVPHPAVLDASPIKAELLHGVDIMVVRELTGGIYFGEKHAHRHRGDRRVPLHAWRRSSAWCGSRRSWRARRRRKLTSVDKANVLETSRLWRTVVERILPAEFPDVRFEHMLVDSAAMHLMQAAARLRRDRHREHVRRHSHRRGLDAGGLARPAALGIARRRRRAADCSSRSTARRRTSPAAASPIPTRRS